MLFNTIEYFVFFIIVTSLYFFIPQRFKWLFLLLCSYYFYMCWNPAYIVLIIISTSIDYFAGRLMGQTSEKRKRKKYLILSLCSNLGLLFIFKYFNFFNESTAYLFSLINLSYEVHSNNLLLPVGISFYTFQTLSYTIDIYRGERKPEKHIGIFALYVSFFPQLVAGPIERSKRLLPQFYNKITFDYNRVTGGLSLILWGLFKKMVIADRLAGMVDQVYNNPTNYSGPSLIFATILFAFQIFCDFSGYSDIAIGTAQVLGIKLSLNFRRPYFAKNIREFWQRWHISLSSWFRDYLYVALGGNRVVKWRWYYNVLIVFILSGLWHGADWTFIIWGALNGIYLLCSIWTKNWRISIIRILRISKFPKFHSLLKIGVTFSLTCFAWIFFRANSLDDAGYIITHMFSGLLNAEKYNVILSGFGSGSLELALAISTIFIMEIVHVYQEQGNFSDIIKRQPAAVRLVIYSVLVLSIILLGNYSANQFIYFQF